jgi:transcriptional regulator with XRE-family HTH domain
MTFGKRVKEWRKHRDLTQAKLAELADLSTTGVACIERGERQPMLLTALRIAQAFGVPLSDLIVGVKL